MTVRNDLIYAHELLKNKDFEDFVEIKIEKDKIRIRDVGSLSGAYVNLVHNSPYILSEGEFIMFNDVAGMLVKK